MKKTIQNWNAVLVIGLVGAPATWADYGASSTGAADDNFNVYVRDTVSYESNIYKLPDNFGSAKQIAPDASRDDVVNRAAVGGNAKFFAGRQIFQLEGNAEDTRFHENDRLNFVGGNASARWLWQLGNRWSGELGAEYDRMLADFAYTASPVRDLLQQQTYHADVEFELGPRWSLVAGGRGSATDHSASVAEQLNTRTESWTGGVVYKTPRQDAFGVNYTESRTWMPDYEVPPGGTSRDYSDKKTIGWVNYRYSSKTRFEVNAGRIERTYDDNSTNGNFSGAIGRAKMNWDPSSKLGFELAVWRELQARLELGSQYLLSRGVSIDSKWHATDRIDLGLLLSAGREQYKSDLIDPTLASRSDRVTGETFYVDYSPRDYLKLSLSYRGQQRKSNYNINEYDADVVALGVTLTF